jgi:uncharacterized protein (DUF4415 family)
MSGKKNASGSDLAKIDAHVIQPEEYEEIPEWTDEMFDRADFRVGGKLVRRGRPPKDTPKVSVTIRLDPDVLTLFRAGGPGWQSRINDALRKVAGLGPVSSK